MEKFKFFDFFVPFNSNHAALSFFQLSGRITRDKRFGTGKDTIQFPYNKPLPKELIRKIAAYRAMDVTENDARWMY